MASAFASDAGNTCNKPAPPANTDAFFKKSLLESIIMIND
jgi:hypothetical protein